MSRRRFTKEFIYRKIKISFLIRFLDKSGTVGRHAAEKPPWYRDVPRSPALFVDTGGRSIFSCEDYA